MKIFTVVALIVIAMSLVVPAPTIRANEERAETRRPDIVLILTDDQRFDTLDSMTHVQRRIVSRGIAFKNAFVVNPLCCPSRASILTGLYSHSTRVYRQAPPFGRFVWFDDSSTLATWLDDSGYRTGYFGKYIDGGQGRLLDGYVPPGWDQFTAFVHAAYYGYKLSLNGTIQSYGEEPRDYSTDLLARHAVAFLERGPTPAFIVFAPPAPHAPATPAERHETDPVPPWAGPPNFNEVDVSDKPLWLQALPRFTPGDEEYIRDLRARQYRSLQSVDDAVRAFIAAQQARARLDTTLFIYTSDNGLAWGEHRWTKKEVPYEESIRVPLLLRYDPLIALARVEDEIALNIDIAPTIAKLTGVEDVKTDGRSLLPLVRQRARNWRSDFLIEHLQGSNPVTTYCAVRSERHLYVRYRGGFTELYDLRLDPFQLQNVSGASAVKAVESTLAIRLRQLCQPPLPPVPPIVKGTGISAASAVLAALGVSAGALVLMLILRRRYDRTTV